MSAYDFYIYRDENEEILMKVHLSSYYGDPARVNWKRATCGN